MWNIIRLENVWLFTCDILRSLHGRVYHKALTLLLNFISMVKLRAKKWNIIGDEKKTTNRRQQKQTQLITKNNK